MAPFSSLPPRAQRSGGEGGEGASPSRVGGRQKMANAKARELRKNMTPQEVKLWVRLRQLRPLGFHFRRQAPLDGYILDFVCFKHKLIVEADGAQHGYEAGLRHDARRDALFAASGFRVLRFWNNEIDVDLDSVVETILARVNEAPPPGFALLATLPALRFRSRGRD